MIGRLAAASRSTASATSCGIGLHAPDLGLIHRRGLVGLVGHVFDLLQVVGNAQDHRAPLDLGDVEGLAHIVHHARHAMRGDVTCPGRRHQRRLVDVLVVELGVDRRLAGKHHHRQAGANRGRQRRHQLGHAGAAGDRGNGELAGRYVVGCRRRDGNVLVPARGRYGRPAVWQRRWTSACCRRPSGRTACPPPPQGTHPRGLRRVWAWARYYLL